MLHCGNLTRIWTLGGFSLGPEGFVSRRSTIILDELDALWRVRFGQPLPIRAEPEMIIRVMRIVEEKRLAEIAACEALSQA
ncbi:hypothetical protein BH11PSE2_BH11PSE2_09860 [soil metagenome]